MGVEGKHLSYVFKDIIVITKASTTVRTLLWLGRSTDKVWPKETLDFWGRAPKVS